MGDKKNALKTILCLGDMQLLTQPQPWGEYVSMFQVITVVY